MPGWPSKPYDRFERMEQDLQNSELPKDDLPYLIDRYKLNYLVFENKRISELSVNWAK